MSPADDAAFPRLALTPESGEVRSAYAKHGYGWDAYRGREATTFIFADADCRRPLGWITGHVPHGHVWEYSLSERYALALVGAAQAHRVAA